MERVQHRPASRQVSLVDIDHRQETSDQPSRLLHPANNIQPGLVYRLSEGGNEEEQAVDTPPRTQAVSSKVQGRADKLRLHPDQEHMRMTIAKSLTLKKQSKASSFLDKLLRK